VILIPISKLKKNLFVILSLIEDYLDSTIVDKTDFSKGKDFEKVAKELGI